MVARQDKTTKVDGREISKAFAASARAVTLAELRFFRAAAEHENLQRAADEVFVDPSALARSIRGLENKLGVKLFDRVATGLRITVAGQVFLTRIEQVLAHMDAAVRDVRLADGQNVMLRIGVADGMMPPRLAHRLSAWRVSHPDSNIELTELDANRLASMLRRGELDVGFSFGVEPEDGLVQQPVWTAPLMVVLPANHAWGNRNTVSLREVVQEPLILTDPHRLPGIRRQMADLILALNPQPTIVTRASSFAGFLNRIAMGQGIGLADADHLRMVIRSDIVARPLLEADAVLRTHVLYRDTGSPRSASLDRFIQHVSRPDSD